MCRMLKDRYAVTIAPAELLRMSVVALRDTVAGGSTPSTPDWIDWERECTLPPEVTKALETGEHWEAHSAASHRRILLTGATGFLGFHVLQQLLSLDSECVVTCLVRRKGTKGAEQRLAESFEGFGVHMCQEWANRVRAVGAHT